MIDKERKKRQRERKIIIYSRKSNSCSHYMQCIVLMREQTAVRCELKISMMRHDGVVVKVYRNRKMIFGSL